MQDQAVKRRVVPADGIREAQRVLPPAFNLQHASFLAAQGFRHHAWAACPLLSVKCMFNGRALYRADRSWFSVDDRGYLILNDQQPYESGCSTRPRATPGTASISLSGLLLMIKA
jgi:hypothetical protein